MLGCIPWYENSSYEVPEGFKYLKFNSFISTFEFQWILIIIRKDASLEMTNNNKKTSQNYIPVQRGKYSPSPIDRKHHFRDKIFCSSLYRKKMPSIRVVLLLTHSLIQEFCECRNEN